MRKLLTLLTALAAVVGVAASSFGGSMGLLGVGRAPNAPAGTTFVFDNSNTGTFSAATTFNHSLPAVAANALCVVSIITNGGPIISVSDAAGAYTAIGQDSQMSLWYAYRTTSQSAGATLTVTHTSSNTMDLAFASFTGAASAQIDSGGTYVAGGATTPAWTTSIAKTLAVGAIGPNTGNLTPATSGWVGISFPSAFNTLAYKITSGTLAAENLGADGSGGYFGSVTTAFK